jgi:hypothetical protein
VGKTQTGLDLTGNATSTEAAPVLARLGREGPRPFQINPHTEIREEQARVISMASRIPRMSPWHGDSHWTQPTAGRFPGTGGRLQTTLGEGTWSFHHGE